MTQTAVATSTATRVSTDTPLPPSSTATATRTATARPPTATVRPTNTAAPIETPTTAPTVTPTTIARPLVEPATGGFGVAFVQSTTFPLADVGYSVSEFFLTGTARAYTSIGELGEDGVWAAAPAGSAPYKTRIVVYRPIDPQRFNGTVVVEWLNVSGGVDAAPDWTSTHTELIREGYAWVGVSAQKAGIESDGGVFDLTLKTIDPVRYAPLEHPGDSFSYDMFTQAAHVAADPDPNGIDPLGGIRPTRLIAAGESQSAFRLTTYYNAIHPLLHLFDGFLIHSRGGGSAPLSEAPEPAIATPDVVRLRTDQPEPVLTFQTETDLIVLGYLPARQADGPTFRLWEVPGTAHVDTYGLVVGFGDLGNSPVSAEILITSTPIPGFLICDRPINSGPQHFVLKAAIAALDTWIRGAGAPPMAPRMDVAGTPAAFVLDEHGNVRGGIRTPALDVPLAMLSGLGQTGSTFCGLFGTTVPFDSETLASLYPSHDAYVSAVNEATDRAVAAGFIRPADAPLIKAAAQESDVGS